MSPSVDLVPNRITTSTSRGIGRPGGTNRKSTSGSIRSGSASSKFAKRDNIGAAIRTRRARPVCWCGDGTASSAGSSAAAGAHGITPKHGQPVRRAMKDTPASNSVGSPRNLLTANPTISAASSGSSTTRVPTSAAITPPRSMSPRRHTGTPAARAKPMFAMSPARRLTSAGLPAPSTMTRSCVATRRAKLSITAASRRARPSG